MLSLFSSIVEQNPNGKALLKHLDQIDKEKVRSLLKSIPLDEMAFELYQEVIKIASREVILSGDLPTRHIYRKPLNPPDFPSSQQKNEIDLSLQLSLLQVL